MPGPGRRDPVPWRAVTRYVLLLPVLLLFATGCRVQPIEDRAPGAPVAAPLVPPAPPERLARLRVEYYQISDG